MVRIKKTMIRVDVAAARRLVAQGKAITHNPRCSANDALYAVLGELDKLTETIQPQPEPQPAVEQP